MDKKFNIKLPLKSTEKPLYQQEEENIAGEEVKVFILNR